MSLFLFDTSYRNKGFTTLAGIDEAGRGPWAGPVVAAAVVLPSHSTIPGLTDSKKLTPHKREKIFNDITHVALAMGVAVIGQDVIDSYNIRYATHRAMKQALEKITLPLDRVLIDGLPAPCMHPSQESIVRGDSKSASIAAASVIAKVTRDRIMVDLSKEYPQYSFHTHKGYGTQQHYNALRRYGPCPLHRKSFKPVRTFLNT